MRYNQPIQRIQRDSRYQDARALLWNILHRTMPAETQLSKVFGEAKTPFAKELICGFIESELHTSLTPRPHIDNAPTEISAKRAELDGNKFFQQSQLQLLRSQTPDLQTLTPLYGEYAAVVQRVYTMFLDLQLRRKCGIPTAAHLNRVGGLTGVMGIDESPARAYSAIGALHDCIEDLLNRTLDRKGKPFGLQRYGEFVALFIPVELQNSVILLTNHYDLILDHVRRGLARQEKAISKKAVLAFLETMMKKKFQDLQTYLTRMHRLLSSLEAERDFYEAAQWLLYKELYIHDMAETTKQMGNYRTYEIKAIDLADNAYGRDSLAMSGRIKNLIKMDVWARKGYALKSSWSPLNNHIIELEEDALVHAEHMIIRDFLENASTLDFLASALLKIKDLSPVFFIDKTH